MASTKATEKEEMSKELESMSGVEVKLLKIQQELFVPKDKKNEYGSYNYRSCEDIEKAVKPLLNKYNCTLQLQTELTEVAGRLFVKATSLLYDNDSGKGSKIYGFAEIGDEKRGNMSAEQRVGSAISYARKYSLAGMFLIDNEKDTDATNRHGQEEAKKPDTINDTQIKAINAELERTGVSASVILADVKKKSIEELTHEDYIHLMKRLKASSDKE